ncbi:MAG: hypothetical protein AAB532_04270 [Patescibacteria group bacterium]
MSNTLETLKTTHGNFEAFIRGGGRFIDVVSDNGHAETLDGCTAMDALERRRRFAQGLVSLSQTRVRRLTTIASVLGVASGLATRNPQRIAQGIAGLGVSGILYKAKPYFQERADIAGISQEAIEIARR